MSAEDWEQAIEQQQARLRGLGENPRTARMIGDVQNIAVLKLFLAAGDELELAPSEVKRSLLGLETGGQLRCTRD